MPSSIFEPSKGFIYKDAAKIQREKIEMIRASGIEISSSPNSIFSILNEPSSLQDELLINEVFQLFNTINNFFSDLDNQLRIPTACTFSSIHKTFMKTGLLDFVNIISSAGKVSIYLILKPNIEEDELTKGQIWQVIHDKFPIGTLYEGDKEVSGYASTKQLINYKYQLGKRKYATVRVTYKLVSKNLMIRDIDTNIRKIFQQVVDKNYNQMGVDFEYQDFLNLVSLIQGVCKVDIEIYLKDDPDQEIDENATWIKNKNVSVKDDEVLVFDTRKKLLISIAGND